MGPRALVEGRFFCFLSGSAQIGGLGGRGRKKVNQINLCRWHVTSRATPRSDSDGYVKSCLFSYFSTHFSYLLFFYLKFGRGGGRSQSHGGLDSSTVVT